MKGHFQKHWLAPLEEMSRPPRDTFASRISRIAFIMAYCLVLPTLVAAQKSPGEPPVETETQRCAALAKLNLEDAPGGPALVTSARLVDVPATGLERWILTPSGYGSSAANSAPRMHEYCDVSGYVAPQNKFELKLPLPRDWNQKFFFYACGAFCGSVFGDSCNLGLARGYANGTPDLLGGFVLVDDPVAANEIYVDLMRFRPGRIVHVREGRGL